MPNFRGNEDLGKLGKEYLNDLLCKFNSFCLQHSKTFDISHDFLQVTIAELSTLKQVRFFGPPCILLCLITRRWTDSLYLQMCELSFKQRSNLSKHMQTAHSSRRPFSCRFCSKTFAINSNLKDHEKIHTDDRQFPCLLCPKRFITAAALKAHVGRHDSRELPALEQSQSLIFSDNSRHHTCGMCGKLFTSIAALRQHMAVHSTVRSFACKTCGKSFKHSSNLYAHRRLHQHKEQDIVKLRTDWVACEVMIPSLSVPHRNSAVAPLVTSDIMYQ